MTKCIVPNPLLSSSMKTDLRGYSLKSPAKSDESSSDPYNILESLSTCLNNNGGLKETKDVENVLLIMKNTEKMVAKCISIYILQVTTVEVLEKFVKQGGWALLNKWLINAKDEKNIPLQIEILKLLVKLPLKVPNLRENNTAKIVKVLSKCSDTALCSAAKSLMEKFMGIIHGTSNGETSAKKMKYKSKEKMKQNAKVSNKSGSHSKEPVRRNSSENTKSAPVAKVPTKFRKTGLEQEPQGPPIKKKSKLSDKKIPLKRTSGSNDADMPADKKNKPSPTPPPVVKEKKITISGGFMDALNSLPQIPQKRIKRKVSKSNNNPTPKPLSSSNHNNNSAEITHSASEPSLRETEEIKKDEPSKPRLNRFGKPMKSVKWLPDSRLTSVRYFEVHENERVNVSTPSFKEAMLREHMFERQSMKGAKMYSDGKRSGDWRRPHLIDLPEGLVVRGSNSIEKEVQREREKTVLQEIFLTKEMVPDTPSEPDPEPYEIVHPVIIPLEDENHHDVPEGSSSPVSENINTISTVLPSNNNLNNKSESGDLKEKLKEILQTASAITPSSDNQQYPQNHHENHQNMMPPMYNDNPQQPPMGMPNNMQPPPMGMPPNNYYGGPPPMMMQPPPMNQNFNVPPPWQYQMGPPPPHFGQFNNNQRPPWQNNRGRPRHAR